MRLRWVAVLVVLGACRPSGVSDVLVGEVPDFGEVPLGARRVVQLEVQNTGKHPASLALTATSLGTQTGELRVVENGVETLRTLRAEVKGAVIDVVTEYRFATTSFISDGTPEIASASLVVRNVGTEGSLLTLGTPRIEGSTDLCAGAFISDSCQEWAPAPLLATGEMRVLPLQLRLTRAGPQTWTVVLPSTDPMRPEVRITVSAEPTSLETCDFELLETMQVGREPVRFTMLHGGSAPCLVREVDFQFGGVFVLEEGPALPLLLPPGQGFDLRVSAVPGAPADARDELIIRSAGGERFKVRFVRNMADCLEVTPPALDLGTAGVGCWTSGSAVVRNSCPYPVPISSGFVVGPAGEPPGGPNCPGPAPCPEFTLNGGISTRLLPPDAGETLFVRYRPINSGADTGAVRLDVASASVVLSLTGRGGSNTQQTETFRVGERPTLDWLTMVDVSPSFVARRAEVRNNLNALLTRFGGGCYDLRWAVAPADGDPDAGVRFSLNDAGEPWTSALQPDFVERALSAFDALPVGSETEACVGPAADLITDAGVRPDAGLVGLCVTDALEQSVNPTAALARFRAQADGGFPSWNVVAPFVPNACSVESLDDGTHEALAYGSLGTREELCTPQWHQAFAPLGGGSSPRGPYFLSWRPAQGIELLLDGVAVDPSRYTYDATNNHFTFALGAEPTGGQTITVSYVAQCIP